MRFSTRTLLVGVAVAAVLAAVVGSIFRSVENSLGALKEFYVLEQTRMMLIEFVQENQGAWPSGWDDLSPHYRKYQNLGWSQSLESHQEMVDVDFTFDPDGYFGEDTRKNSASPQLVLLKSRWPDLHAEEVDEINRLLLAMLRSMYLAE